MPAIPRRLSPLSFKDVVIDDCFWSPRIRVNREQSIPYEYDQCKETGRISGFDPDWMPDLPNKGRHIFNDSDVAKWIEAASYSLVLYPDPQLDALLDEVIELIGRTQQSDGYVNSYFVYAEPDKRWSNLRDFHELYCAGHLIEAAVAHYQATGKRSLLDIMCRYADYIDSVFGPEVGKKRGYCGHEEIELALVKLYRATNQERYLRLSKYFIDERGQKPNFFELEAKERGEEPSASNEYNQSHLPVREQTVVVGHAVRAMYLYCAMADLAGETDDVSLLDACERLWQNVCLRRMYITGGLGPCAGNEGFTTDYDLPNETAYAETCAAIGLVFWNHRLLQLGCDGRFADVMERALYNGVLSGVSLDGKRFFYGNPLGSTGGYERSEWFGTACCPPNLARLLASLGGYVYSQSKNEAVVHLYVQGSGKFTFEGRTVKLTQKTNYPWSGSVDIAFEMNEPAVFALKLRVPGWCRQARVSINGLPADLSGIMSNGYISIEREWTSRDQVELELPMPVERMVAHPSVRDDAGRVALQRGPIVFCLEEADNCAPVHQIILTRESEIEARFEEDLLNGTFTLNGEALALGDKGWDRALYSMDSPTKTACTIKAIPYCLWANRGAGRMAVWIREC